MTLRLDRVSKTFGTTTVLRDVSLAVPDGTRLALVGASGSGKSTLLRLVAGFEEPDAGEIALGDRVLAGRGRVVPAHRRRIGYVAQDGALFPHLSVARNIAFGLPRGADRVARVRELLALVSLAPDFAERMPHQLSGGQQQRVALARALAQRPDVILLDEPFSALDTGLRAHTREAVVDVLERSGVTAVLVTHDQEEALTFGQQVGVLSDGELVQAGEPAAVFDAPRDAGVALFLGDAVLLPAEVAGPGTVDCALGRVAVRHDRSGGARAVRAMLRPDQLSVRPADAATANATVTAVRSLGAAAELTLRLSDGEELTHRVPLHDVITGPVCAYAPRSRVAVAVEGGVVLYAGEGALSAAASVQAAAGSTTAV
ncbi:ATP-binding cassette domain-containing protein [Microbacterium sp. MEC084]|uniref:ABC transporter ATP-binding protein n=1 Tax=Microbacterium sp. MEC084 TaxID=1963027 RepID=UPI00106FF124|nr:ABC transporter ATP-binding protein [Microbacterium sp. MEC084]MCD1267432.1 ATP-binding cassette domain-containing protein [Microbacterium sp. MEC084]